MHPRRAHLLAEVLDKLELPWQPAFFIGPVIFALACAALAWSERAYVVFLGLVLAVLFAAFSLWADPWFTPDIGSALRVELSAAEERAWLVAVLVQASLPLVTALLVRLYRVRSLRGSPAQNAS